MNRSCAYAWAGLVLAGLAVWILRNHSDGEPRGESPLDDVDRMMSQTRRKVTEIQRNLTEFRDVLARAADPETCQG